ncbi:NBR1-Ig-like domain-containing protein [Hyalangium versicolor]|uniref:NBR1-Ig-like domain-containing protein n=1 Tax=Hyalangium versicolor TaxID=2861190 RepID=UPI001CCA827C|nr:NBR1-Ig-like domain-containing protein [Hyalangium versicolor]
MFQRLIILTSTLFVSLTASAADNAAFLSQSVPTVLTTGEVRTVSVTMQNTGTTSWTAATYKLGTDNPMDNTLWIGGTRVYMNPGEVVAPGASRTFTFNITAPLSAGSYNFQWRMVQDGVAWFGARSTNVVITVQAPLPLDSQFVSQSVPTTLTVGQTASVSVTMRNTGANVWTAAGQYKLGSQGPQDNLTWGVGRVDLASSESVGLNGQKTFTFAITAPSTAGVYNFQWKMLQEGNVWFGALSPNVAITVSQPPVTLCSGVAVVPDGVTDLGPAIQSCVNATPSGGTLELPAGTYGIATQVVINKPFTLRTQGLASSSANCEALGNACAVLKALPSFSANVGGFVAAVATSNVTFDHLVLDGNRAARLGTTAASQCAAGANFWGFNARMSDCASCRFTYNVSKNTLCGTALEFRGHDGTLTNNVFRSNGQNSQPGMWSDGLTIHISDRVLVNNNAFIDNSDVALILGGGRQAVVTNNAISQPGQVTFAGLMLDNFNSSALGDFTGAVVTGNTIDCSAARNCHFGINLGPHPWYLPPGNILGGDVHGNTVISARQGINVDGAGTASAPLVLYGNSVSNPAPGSASFNCGSHATSALNINTGDSVVNRAGDTAPMTTFVWHNCP